MRSERSARGAGGEDAAFRYDAGAFAQLSVAVDVVLLTIREGAVRVLLHRRPEPPFAGYWALPGGFVAPDEPLDDTARRVLQDKAGVTGVWVEQLYTFGAPDRDPRTRVISVSYLALADLERFRNALPGAPAARDAVITDIAADGSATVAGADGEPLPLAFDHDRIVGTAVTRLRGKLSYTPVGYQLLPSRFTLRQLQTVHETILGQTVNKDSFRRRMLASGELEPTGRREADVEHRPAELYRFRNRPAQ